MPDDSQKHLLFALLACQNELITKAQLTAAFSVWLSDRSKELDKILVEQGALDAAQRSVLDGLVNLHLAKHGDLAKSLAQLSSMDGIVQELQSMVAPELAATLPPEFSEYTTSLTASKAARTHSQREPVSGDDRFRIIRHHANGGLGVVHVAEDQQLRREVALKQIRSDCADSDAYRTKFIQEAEVTGQLEHPGIVPVYGLGTDANGRPYYAMRFIKGEELKVRIQQFHESRKKNSQPFDCPELRSLLRRFTDVCDAIDYAHDRGVLHRDLKPGNVMLGKHGETLVVDWGLAKPMKQPAEADPWSTVGPNQELPVKPSDSDENSATAYGSFLGTPAYAPPEQITGELDKICPQSDVYSLGAILYEILTGRPPVEKAASRADLLGLHNDRKIPVPRSLDSSIPKPLSAICQKAISFQITDRYATATELKEEVERWLDDQPVQSFPESLLLRARRWARQHQAIVSSATVLVLMSMIGLGLYSYITRQANAELDQRNAKLIEANDRETAEREKALALAHDIQRQQRRQAIHRVDEYLSTNELSSAHYWTTQAVPDESPANEHERAMALTRLDVLWNQLTRFTQFWRLPTDLVNAELSDDKTQLIAVDANHDVRIYETVSGRLVTGPLRQDTAIFSAAVNRTKGILVTVGGSFGVSGEMRIWDSVTGLEIADATLQTLSTFVHVVFLVGENSFLTMEVNLDNEIAFNIWRFERENRKLSKARTFTESNGLIRSENSFEPKKGFVLLKKPGKGKDRKPSIEVIRAITGVSVGTIAIVDCVPDHSDVKFDSAEFIAGSSVVRMFLRGKNDVPIVRLWDPEENRLVGGPMVLPEGQPRQVGVVSETDWVVVRKSNGRFMVFSESSPRVLPWQLDAPEGNSDKAVFSDDGRFVAIPLGDGQLQVWDILADRAAGPVLRHGDVVSSVWFSKYGRHLIVGTKNGTFRVWDFATTSRKMNNTFYEEIHGLDSLADGSFLVRSSNAKGPWFERYYKDHDGKQKNYRISVDFANAGRPVVSSDGRFAAVNAKGEMKIGSVFDNENSFPEFSVGKVLQMAFTRDGSMLGYRVSKFDQGMQAMAGDLYLVDTTTSTPMPSKVQWEPPNILSTFLPIQLSGITSFAFAPDGKRLAAGCGRISHTGIIGEIVLVDAATSKPLEKPIQLRSGMIPFQVAFHPTENKILAVCGSITSSGFILIFDLDFPDQPPVEFQLSDDMESLFASSIKYSPDGKYLFVANGEHLEVLDPGTLQRKANALRHSARVVQCIFHSDLPLMATRCADQTVRVWDLENETLFMPVITHDANINDIAFTGKLAISGSDGKLALWPLNPEGTSSADHQRIASVIGGFPSDPHSGDVIADPNQLEADWKILNSAYPEKFTCEDYQIRIWNERIVGLYESHRMWRSAFPLIEELAQLFPDDPQWAERVADYEAIFGDYASAAKWYVSSAGLYDKNERDSHLQDGKAVSAWLAHDDNEEYSQTCKALVDRWKDTEDPQIARHVSKLCLITETNPVDLEIPLQMARRSLEIETKAANTNGQLYSQLVCGMCAYRQNNFSEAVNALKPFVDSKAVLSRSTVMQAHAYLAMALYKLDRKSDGLKHLETVIDLDREYPKSQVARGDWEPYFHFSLALKEVKAMYERINIDDTQDTAFLASRAEGHGRQSDWTQADAIWARIFEIAPKEISNRQRWIDSLAIGERWDEIAAYYNKALGELPAGWKANEPRSKLVHQLAQRGDEAFAALKRLRPDDSLLTLYVARKHVQRCDWELAAQTYSEIVHQPNEPQVKYEHMAALLLAKKEAEAREFMAKCVREAGQVDDYNIAYPLARMAILTTKEETPWSTVIDWAEQAAKKEGKAWHRHVIGMAHLRSGDLNQAQSLFENPIDPKWRPELNQIALCLVHISRGDQTKARDYLAAAQGLLEKIESEQKNSQYLVQETDLLEFHILFREAKARIETR